MIKKVLASVSALALSLSAFVGTASATSNRNFDHGSLWCTVDSGVTYTDSVDEYGSQYITVKYEGAANDCFKAATIRFAIPSGSIDTSEGTYGLVEKVGLHYGSGRNASYPTTLVAWVADGANDRVDTPGDGYDTLSVVIAGSKMYNAADDDVIFELYVTPTDPDADLELFMTHVNITLYDPSDTSQGTSGDWDTQYDDPMMLNTTRYVVAAGTSTVTEAKDALGPNGFTGDKEVYGDDLKTDDQSKAWGLSIDKVEGKTYVYKLYEGTTAKFEKAAAEVNNDDLTGTLKVGLILTYNPDENSAFAAITGAAIEVDE